MDLKANSATLSGAAIIVAALIAYRVGFSAGHEAGLADAPAIAEALEAQARADLEWQARINAEPSDEERLFDEIADVIRPYIADEMTGRYSRGGEGPDQMDGR